MHYFVIIILKGKRKLVALLLLSYRCSVIISLLWLFVMVPSVGLQCVIVVCPDHTHLLSYDVNQTNGIHVHVPSLEALSHYSTCI